MATGDFDADTLAWFINSVPARTLAIEPGEIEFDSSLFSLSPGYITLVAERDSLLAAVEDLRAALARQIDRAEFWKTECGRREAANDVLIAEAKEIGAALAAALDPHDFGDAVETIEIEIPDARDGITLTSASHPTDQFAETGWPAIFNRVPAGDPQRTDGYADDLARAIATIDKLTSASASAAPAPCSSAPLPDQVFIDDIETGTTETNKIEPTDPRAVALARALRF